VQVLEQGIPQHRLVGGVLDHRWDGREAGELRRAQAPLPHDQLVLRAARVATGDRAHDDRLEHTELADRDDELVELLLAEFRAWLHGVRHDIVGRQLGEPCSRHRDESLGAAGSAGVEEDVDRAIGSLIPSRDESADAPAESGALRGHQLGAPRRAISAAASR
jgi:hypothetical protein